MKTLKVLAIGLLGLTGCTSTAYEKQATAFKESFGSLDGARTALKARQVTITSETQTNDDQSLLVAGSPLEIDKGCIDTAKGARETAVQDLVAGRSLDALYASGAMKTPAACRVAVADPDRPDEPKPKGAPKERAAPVEDAAAKALAEASADEALCQARIRKTPRANRGGKPTSAEELVSTSNDVWGALSAYADALPALAASEQEKKAGEAVAGARDAVKEAVEALDGKNSVYAAVADLLFLGLDKAIQQRRYEAFKTAVICGNPIVIRAQPVLRDYLRYEQLAAYSVRASALSATYEDLSDDFDAAPAGCNDNSYACSTTKAQEVLNTPGADPQAVLVAWTFLEARAARLKSRLVAAQATTKSVNDLGRADPAAALDAFVTAHRKLRDDVMANQGQSKALRDSFKAFRDAAEALDKALGEEEGGDAKQS